MTLSTTPTLEGNPIRQYLGVVTAESIVGANFVKDFMANVRDAPAPTKVCSLKHAKPF